jgi:uncharacterized membrane protein YbhN (UPF0104 family)
LVKFTIVSIVSGFLLWFVIINADWQVLKQTLHQAAPEWLFAAALGMIFLQIVSGIRLWQLLRFSSSSCRSVLGMSMIIACSHQIGQRFLPLRLGEALMLWMVAKLMGAQSSASLRSWVVLRLWDARLVTICAGLGGGYMLYQQTKNVYFFALCLLIPILLMLFSPEKILKTGLTIILFFKKILNLSMLDDVENIFLKGIWELKSQKASNFWLIFLAVLGWGSSWFIFYSLLQSMGFDISLIATMGVVGGAALVSALPVQSIAGLGVNETAQAGLFLMAGLNPQFHGVASFSLAFSVLHMSLCFFIPAIMIALLILFLGIKNNGCSQKGVPI